MADWLTGKITQNRQWTERLYSLRFTAPLGEFKAGQFVRIALEIDGEIVARPYSLVNSPAEPELEIFFNIVPQGPLTPRLAVLQQGDVIRVADRTSGFLTIDQVPAARHLWMLATGTGVGPFVSILKTTEAWQRFEKIVLVYSVRTAHDLAYQDVIAGINEAYQQFSFVPVITRESVPRTLNARIPDALQSGQLEELAGIGMNPEDSHVMMCGNSAMIADVNKLLEQRSMRKHLRREPGHITTEKYH